MNPTPALQLEHPSKYSVEELVRIEYTSYCRKKFTVLIQYTKIFFIQIVYSV